MFVLIGEYAGDYDDFYERRREVIMVSPTKERLEKYMEEDKEFLDAGGFVELVIEDVDYIE